MNSSGNFYNNLIVLAAQYFDMSSVPRAAVLCTLLLLVGDLLFISLHSLAYSFDWGSEWRRFSVSKEGGIPELFNYAKLSLVTIVLWLAYLRSRVLIYLFLAFIFAYACADDAFTIHERLSFQLGELLELPFSIRNPSYTQPLYFSIVAAISALFLTFGWIKATPIDRQHALALIASLAFLAVFVVVVDAVHSLVDRSERTLNEAFKVIEDGGELIAVTLSFWIAVVVYNRLKQLEPRD